MLSPGRIKGTTTTLFTAASISLRNPSGVPANVQGTNPRALDDPPPLLEPLPDPLPLPLPEPPPLPEPVRR
jgi:hypothetical protein